MNDIWGAEVLKGPPAQWNTPIWAHDIDKGLRIVRLGLEAHLITSHYLLPLLVGRRGGLVVEITDGRWRDALAPTASPQAPPGFAASESPRYVGRAVAALAADPERHRWNQRSLTSGQAAAVYGFTDVDGSRPDVWPYNEDVDKGMDVDPNAYR